MCSLCERMARVREGGGPANHGYLPPLLFSLNWAALFAAPRAARDGMCRSCTYNTLRSHVAVSVDRERITS